MDATLVRALTDIVGVDHVRTDDKSRSSATVRTLGIVHPPDVVAVPGTVQEIAAIARLCNARQVPLVVRGAGTGYTGGAVPTRGGVVLSVERLNRFSKSMKRICSRLSSRPSSRRICSAPSEAVGCSIRPILPASSSSIGGNVAECAGGPRGFKYGTTRRYVLALEAVLPNGEIIETGSSSEERRRVEA